MPNSHLTRADWLKRLKTFIPLFGSVSIAALLFLNLDGTNFLNVHMWRSVGGDGLKGESVHHILLVASIAFVFLNTYFFFFDLQSDAEKYGGEKHISRSLKGALGVTIVSLLVITAWMGITLFMKADDLAAFPPLGHQSHEILAMLVFGLFLLIDNLLMRTANDRRNFLESQIGQVKRSLEVAMLVGRDREFAEEKLQQLQFAEVSLPFESLSTKAQLWLIDVPVLVGLLTVFVLLQCVFQHEWVMSDHIIFSDGFTAGAVAMHVVSSQVIFVLLSLWSQKEIRAKRA